MKTLVCVISLFYVLSVSAKDRFLLESELFTNFSSSPQTHVFTGYTYNDSGYRVLKSAYNGLDSNAAALSRTFYSYNPDNTVSEEILKTVTGDTVSIVHYGYDSAKRQTSIFTLTKARVLRYVDSMVYDAAGNQTMRKRYSGGALSFYDTYTYDIITAKKTSDTLYESNGSGFSATQAVVFSYDASGRAIGEKDSRFQAGSWYLISTNKMAYSSNGFLLSVTRYEGDGTSSVMQDSLAYAYDSWGNRIKESDYGDDRALISTTDYTWLDTQPTLVSATQKTPKNSRIKFENGMVYLTDVHGDVFFSLYDPQGRLVTQSRHQGDFAVAPGPRGYLDQRVSPGPTGLGRGGYVAVVRYENQTSAFHFVNMN